MVASFSYSHHKNPFLTRYPMTVEKPSNSFVLTSCIALNSNIAQHQTNSVDRKKKSGGKRLGAEAPRTAMGDLTFRNVILC